MKLASVWTSIVQVFNVLTFSSPEEITDVPTQIPFVLHDDDTHEYHPGPKIPVIQTDSGEFFHGNTPLIQEYSSGMVYHPDEYKDVPLRTGGQEFSYVFKDTPVVGTPKNPQEGVGGGLHCQYPTMKGWEPCYSPKNRTCWLKKGNQYIDINTDYEDASAVPVGRVRRVGTHTPFPNLGIYLGYRG
jgi:hypothetical protein